MKTNICLLAFLLLGCIARSQTPATSYQKFLDDFVKGYAEVSIAPMDNYFTVLSKAASRSFDISNPFFLPALREVKQELRSDEITALDSLYFRTYAYLTVNAIWISNMEIYNTYHNMFDVYNRSLCGCMTPQMKKTDMMEKMLKASQVCISKALSDTSFINEIHAVGGKITLNELFKVQQFLVAYMYQNCEIYNYKFTETISHTPVYEQYYRAIENSRKADAEKVLQYYKDKDFVKLTAIFPNYKKYSKQLNSAVLKTKDKSLKTHLFYAGNTEDHIPCVYYDLFSETQVKYKMKLILNTNTLNALFTSITFEENTEVVPDEDRIEEISVDTTRPIRKN